MLQKSKHYYNSSCLTPSKKFSLQIVIEILGEYTLFQCIARANAVAKTRQAKVRQD